MFNVEHSFKLNALFVMIFFFFQVAAQQGNYLARCFNKMKICEEHPEGPLRIRGTGRHRFHPFRYVDSFLYMIAHSCFLFCTELHYTEIIHEYVI